MFGKKRRQQQQEFEQFVAEERRGRIDWARALANELAGERKEKALKRITEYEQKK